MLNDFAIASIEYECSLGSYYDDEDKEECDQDYYDNLAYDNWRDWCAEQNIRQAENAF